MPACRPPFKLFTDITSSSELVTGSFASCAIASSERHFTSMLGVSAASSFTLARFRLLRRYPEDCPRFRKGKADRASFRKINNDASVTSPLSVFNALINAERKGNYIGKQ